MAISDYKTALVTGASGGIGAAVVKAFCEHGLQVHAVARRTERLADLAKTTGCTPHTLDVRESKPLYELGESRNWDIVVNNAGVIRGFENLYEARPEDIDAALETNIRATYHLLRAVLPGMVERRRGHIIIIGSMAGLYALKSSVYGGSKAALHMLARNLRLELQSTGVRVTEICPGRVETELYDQAVRDPVMLKQIKDTRIKELEPKDIAAAILYAVDTPWHVNVNTIELQPTEQTYGGSQFVPFVQNI